MGESSLKKLYYTLTISVNEYQTDKLQIDG